MGLFSNNCWLKEEDIEDVVQNGWKHGESHNVMQRIGSCTEELENWNRVRYSRKKDELKRHKEIVERYRRNHDLESMSRFLEAQKEYNKMFVGEDTYWKQRDKMHWLQVDDLNMKLFHLTAMTRKNFQKIDMKELRNV
ncbi:unnamed protein product [Lathyrus sativus]|nr:unnamed protein product [Lathyrus sativus]